MASHSTRLRQAVHPSALQLELRDRAATGMSQPQGHCTARKGSRRVQLDQWTDLHPRAGGGLQRLAATWEYRWSYDDVLPYFRKAEDNERGADQFHGVGGP